MKISKLKITIMTILTSKHLLQNIRNQMKKSIQEDQIVILAIKLLFQIKIINLNTKILHIIIEI
jgi:hypothetical protein